MWRSTVLLLLLLVAFCWTTPPTNAFSITSFPTTTRTQGISLLSSSMATPVDDDITWIDDDDNDDNDDVDEPNAAATTAKKLKSSRWDSLNPKIKARIVQAGQQRAIENKMKREPAQAKKRRMMMFVKEQQRAKKRASRVQRLIPLHGDHRTPLSALVPGMELTGIVISLTNFGAYIDIGSECDGLLHISQISHTDFISHPRQVMTPGQEVIVKVRSFNADRKKLHLTMLPDELLQAEEQDENSMEDRIPLEDIQVDDELWGEIKRVTQYGAYVEVGAVVDGFLHVMDHPEFVIGKFSNDLMKTGDRVRVWVMDVNRDLQRIKLTAERPTHLPGPRREL